MLLKKSSLMIVVRVALVAITTLAYVFACRFGLNVTYYMDDTCNSFKQYGSCKQWDFGSLFAWNPRDASDWVPAGFLGLIVLAAVALVSVAAFFLIYWLITGRIYALKRTAEEEYIELVDCTNPECPCVIHEKEDKFDQASGKWVDPRFS